MCFASSDAGAFSQLIMGLMDVPGLCSFIMACKVGGCWVHVCVFPCMFLLCYVFVLF
jgi:hypothetical protein